MDTLTHALLGAVTAQLGFRQKIGRDATSLAAAAAAAPDLDILAVPVLEAFGHRVSGTEAMAIHRGLSHSLLLAPLFALAIAGLWQWGRARRRAAPATATPFWLLYACVLVAYACHPLLDWCTSYGTQILAPLVHTRYALDIIAIVDLFYTPILILTLVACALVRKVRGSPAARATLAIGWIGFGLSLAYLATGYVMHERAVGLARGLVGDAPVVTADAYPAPGTIFLWRGVVRTESAWTVARVRPLEGRVTKWSTVPDDSGPWVEQAKALPEVKTLEWFSMGRLRASSREAGGNHAVQFDDMRYGPSPESTESLWPLEVTFDEAGRPSVKRATPIVPVNRWEWIREAWRDLWRP